MDDLTPRRMRALTIGCAVCAAVVLAVLAAAARANPQDLRSCGDVVFKHSSPAGQASGAAGISTPIRHGASCRTARRVAAASRHRLGTTYVSHGFTCRSKRDFADGLARWNYRCRDGRRSFDFTRYLGGAV